MARLDYSIEARNVLGRFYQVDQMLYVEGDDDVPFWEAMFEKFEGPTVQVQHVGGKDELKKYIERIVAGQLDAFVAMDSDFAPFTNSCINHPRILRTAGYSIENSLVSAETLVKVTRRTGRLPAKDVTLEACQAWLSEFFSKIEGLVVNDITDQCEGERLGVVPQNCARFLTRKGSSQVCSEKIGKYLDSFGFERSPPLSEQLASIQIANDVDLWDFARGHFVFSAAHSFVCVLIKKKRSKISIPQAAFLGSILLAFEAALDEAHPHFEHYRDAIKQLPRAA